MRCRKANATKGGWDPVSMERALEDVLKNSMSERRAANVYGVKRSTLKRRLKEARQLPDCSGLGLLHCTAYNNSAMKIFSLAEEKQLVDYCLRASKMGYGLSPIKLRQLAYEFAAKLQKRLPHSRPGLPNPWEENKQAGQDWFRAFLRRHQELSVRKPESTSIGRMSAFNKHNVDVFYSNLRDVLEKYQFEPNRVWNCDETGVSTVQVPEHVIAGKGERQVASVTSAERGTLVTMCNAVNACGSSVPPFYVFPRVHFKDIFLKNGLPGCAGTAQITGWMVETTFVQWLHHFIAHVHPSKTNPVLLILDNHETHMSIDFIDLAADNGIVVLTIPPHTTHKLQPLDVSVYGPFKRLYNREMDTWLVSHPGKTVSIYDIAEVSGKAWSKAAMPANVISGFAASGIHPFQPDIWQDEHFCLAQVTDRPNPQPMQVSQSQLADRSVDSAQGEVNSIDICLEANATTDTLRADTQGQCASTPTVTVTSVSVSAVSTAPVQEMPVAVSDSAAPVFTPLSIRPLPAAPARQQQGRGCRKKLASSILTSTPVKESIREKQSERRAKKLALAEKKSNSKPKPSNPKKKQIQPKKVKKSTKQAKKVSQPSVSSDDESSDCELNEVEVCNDDSDDDIEDDTTVRPVCRKQSSNKSDDDKCLVCGEFGHDKEWWYRCTVCASWAHEACTSTISANNYVCDFCEDS